MVLTEVSRSRGTRFVAALAAAILRTIVEYMTEMRIGNLAAHFDTRDAELHIGFRSQSFFINRLDEAWPACARIVFVMR